MPAGERQLRTAALALVGLLAAFAYANTLDNGFVLDDVGAISHNEVVTGRFSLGRLLASDFRGGARDRPGGRRTSAYRPLVDVGFAVDWQLAGGRPWLFHAANLGWHALASVLLCAGLLGLGVGRAAATLAGALFAVHPLHTDAVSSIVGRADVLSGLLALLAWWWHRRAARGASGRWAALLSSGALLAGLLCKETTILALPVLIVTDARAGRLRAQAPRYLGHALAVGAAAFLRFRVVGDLGAPPATLANVLVGVPWHVRLGTALELFAHGLWLHLVPLELLPDYGYGVVTPATGPTAPMLLGLAAVLALGTLLVRAWRQPSPVADAAAFVLVPGLFAVNALVVLPASFAERWWYLPSAGVCVLAGLGCDALARRWRSRLPFAVGAALVALLAGLTILRNRDWRSEERLWVSAVATSPAGAFAQYQLGAVRDAEGRLDEALAAYRVAEASEPDWAEPHAAAAVVLARLGRVAEAEAAFAAMRATGHASAAQRRNYVVFLRRLGRLDEAAREEQAIAGALDAR